MELTPLSSSSDPASLLGRSPQPSGNSFAALLHKAAGQSAAPPPSLSDANSQGLSQVSARLLEALQQAGVDSAQEIRLRVDANGSIDIQADDATRDLVQQTLQQRPDLVRDLAQLAAKTLSADASRASPLGEQPKLTLTIAAGKIYAGRESPVDSAT